jgi:hypothetical protein
MFGCMLLAGLGVAMALLSGVALAKIKPDKAYTFFLTDNRICRKCYWRLIGNDYVELSNEDGIRATYHRDQIIGIDTHPLFRRIHRKGITGVGLPGRIIVPQAFDDEKRLEAP